MKIIKKVSILFIALIIISLSSCIDVTEIDYMEFVQIPKTVYLVGEEMEDISVRIVMEDGESYTLNSSSSDELIIMGFDTDTIGSRTMTITVKDHEKEASINILYTVVKNLDDLLFAGGSGTEADPYQIETPQQLSNIRLALDKHFQLIADIDLEGIEWLPIGGLNMQSCGEGCGRWVIDETEQFTGSLSGDNETEVDYKIMNLSTISNVHAVYGENWIENFALFGSLQDAVVENIIIENVNIYGHRVAGLAIVIRGTTRLENVGISGIIKTTYAAGGVFVNSRETNTTEGTTMSIINVINRANIIGLRDSNYVNMMGGLLSQTGHGANAGYGEDLLHIKGFENQGNITHLYSVQSGTIAGQILGQLNNGNVTIEDSIGNGIITGNAVNNANNWSWSFYGYTYDNNGDVIESLDKHYYQGPDSTIEGMLVGRKLGYTLIFINSAN